ncbi:MAG TPA: hypothetical protein VFL69_13910 [Marmoricola sp.]|nr:hypothetical protein [Marmoricola sp.]
MGHSHARSRSRILGLAAGVALLAGVLVGPANAAPPRQVEAASTAAHACDPIVPTSCLLPFPNDWFTVADPGTPTGRRVDLQRSSMPANIAGTHIDPTAWNQSDGFSPGSLILTHVPGIDLARSGAAPITDIGSSLDRDAPIVLLDTDTGRRWPYWAELDANDPDPAEQALLIHPARNLADGHHYIVALRDLRDADGRTIQPTAAFAQFLSGRPQDAAARARLPHMKQLLARLARAGVSRHGLYLAWDFTVASTQNITGRMIAMRDQAFAQLGNGAPAFQVTSVKDYTPDQNPRTARQVTGTFDVPSFLDQPGGPPGSELNLDSSGVPRQLPGNIQHADFVCNIPRSADAGHPAHPSLYGHGLLGRPTEINASNVQTMGNTYDFAFCATSWIGMAAGDIGNVANVFADFSRFESVPDRLQQSMLDFLFLGRLMTTADGFASSPAFQAADGTPLIDDSDTLAYDGNSQGGIMGGALMAIAQDIPRGVLGVTGMNYSTLINRSVDGIPFLQVMDGYYPDKLDQQIIFSLIQMLWDRGEADGYAAHVAHDPLPGTPTHQVLMQVAFGDHQVAPVSAAVEARTIGAAIHRPALAAGRSPDVTPYWGIPTIPSYPYDGSALFVWDSGTPHVPLTNTPPVGPAYGTDPHEMPRAQPAAQQQKATFLTGGGVVDVCAGAPCIGVNP